MPHPAAVGTFGMSGEATVDVVIGLNLIVDRTLNGPVLTTTVSSRYGLILFTVPSY